jgi:hypothetical protein
VEATPDFQIKPTQAAPPIDTSKWPLLLKVRTQGRFLTCCVAIDLEIA